MAMAKPGARAEARPKTPIFDAMIDEARRSPRDTDISHEELGRRLNITDEERRAAQADIDHWLREDAEGEDSGSSADGARTNGRPAAERARRKVRRG